MKTAFCISVMLRDKGQRERAGSKETGQGKEQEMRGKAPCACVGLRASANKISARRRLQGSGCPSLWAQVITFPVGRNWIHILHLPFFCVYDLNNLADLPVE